MNPISLLHKEAPLIHCITHPIVVNPISLLHKEAPLIHCITHPIVVNDCANAVLALGARPIMAEHPDRKSVV